MPVLSLHGDSDIHVEVSFAESPLIREVPGSHMLSPQNWLVPRSWGSCQALRGVFGARLVVGEDVTEWATEEFARRVHPCLWLRSQVELTDEAWGKPIVDLEARLAENGELLFPHQRPGAVFLYVAKCALLADDMGTGKTSNVIAALEAANAYPALIVCPNSVKSVWRREYARMAPERSVLVVEGGAGKRRKVLQDTADVFVINWEALRLHSRLAPYGSIALKPGEKEAKELNEIPFVTVVADEAHRAKSPRTAQTRALWAVGRGTKVQYRYALTGTPIADTPDDLWSIMHFVAPNDYPRKTQYIERYLMKSFNAFGGLEILGLDPRTRDEFFAIFDPRFRRMPKDVVLAHLPPKLHVTREIELPPKMRKAYKELEDTMITELDNGDTIYVTSPLVQATRLMQFASASAHLEPQDDGKDRVILEAPSPKVDELMEILSELPPDEPVVACAASRQLIDIAAARLDKEKISYGLITGPVSLADRERYIEEFQAGKLRVMLMTIAAGGVGITLTKARILVRLQRSWSNLENKQVEDRVHRIGSEGHENVLIVDVIARDTVEDLKQVDRLEDKQRMLEEIVRDRDWLRNAMIRG